MLPHYSNNSLIYAKKRFRSEELKCFLKHTERNWSGIQTVCRSGHSFEKTKEAILNHIKCNDLFSFFLKHDSKKGIIIEPFQSPAIQS